MIVISIDIECKSRLKKIKNNFKKNPNSSIDDTYVTLVLT